MQLLMVSLSNKGTKRRITNRRNTKQYIPFLIPGEAHLQTPLMGANTTGFGPGSGPGT